MSGSSYVPPIHGAGQHGVDLSLEVWVGAPDSSAGDGAGGRMGGDQGGEVAQSRVGQPGQHGAGSTIPASVFLSHPVELEGLGPGEADTTQRAKPSESAATKEEATPWQRLSNELTLGIASEWPSLPTFRRRWRAVTFPVLMPLYALLRLTVPLVDPTSYSQQASIPPSHVDLFPDLSLWQSHPSP